MERRSLLNDRLLNEHIRAPVYKRANPFTLPRDYGPAPPATLDECPDQSSGHYSGTAADLKPEIGRISICETGGWFRPLGNINEMARERRLFQCI